MSLPFGNPDTTFESFLQELPEDAWELAKMTDLSVRGIHRGIGAPIGRGVVGDIVKRIRHSPVAHKSDKFLHVSRADLHSQIKGLDGFANSLTCNKNRNGRDNYDDCRNRPRYYEFINRGHGRRPV